MERKAKKQRRLRNRHLFVGVPWHREHDFLSNAMENSVRIGAERLGLPCIYVCFTLVRREKILEFSVPRNLGLREMSCPSEDLRCLNDGVSERAEGVANRRGQNMGERKTERLSVCPYST